APIAARYFVVELLGSLIFLGCWLTFGHQSAWLALVYCVFLAGLIVATFVDFEHFIIPDEITLGGIAAGFIASFLVPELHGVRAPAAAMRQSFLGIAVGAGLIYGILQLGKILFGRQRIPLPPGSRITFTETALRLPDEAIAYGDLLYRKSDTIVVRAHRVEIVDRGYADTEVRLSAARLQIGADTWDPATVPWLEAVADEIVLPREAMGLGDVKFMAAIGAFLGWPAVVFSLFLSSVLGAAAGGVLILLKKHPRSNPIPYGPYIALAAALWIFVGRRWVWWWLTATAPA
ncbi:MAG: A24 family peptidase, partial [Verrucomicrobia bacterium]|nr:A24 family peptidase [Verrucomicrobiota bacterium]